MTGRSRLSVPRRLSRLLFAALGAASLLAAQPALALEPERREAVVVHGRIWEGHNYTENLLPSSQSRLMLMADRDSAVAFVRTLEYYWPLSRKVHVDFESRREEIDGVLVIEQDGRTIAEIGRSVYAVVYPEGAAQGDGRLVWGEEAEQAYAGHLAAERDFARSFVEAQRAHTAYERALLESGARRKAGEAVAEIAAPPPLPTPSMRLVTRPQPGFRIALAAGRYTAYVRSDGRRMAGTERSLEVVAFDGRRTLVADIVPEERWTRPLASNSEAARIFARPGAVFYLTLTEADRFAETEYLPLVNPQADPVANRTTYVRRTPSTLSEIDLAWAGIAPSRPVTRDRLKVDQTQGSGFGYRVRPAKDGEREDLVAFMVDVPRDEAARRGLIVARATGPEPAEREVVVVQPRNAGLGLAAALLPMAGWTGWALIRRRRGRRHAG